MFMEWAHKEAEPGFLVLGELQDCRCDESGEHKPSGRLLTIVIPSVRASKWAINN